MAKRHARKVYLASAYRVLLARARQGMVIYIPGGNCADATRKPEYYNGSALAEHSPRTHKQMKAVELELSGEKTPRTLQRLPCPTPAP
jgi:hypothetical protein